jgi:hypothetical protein
MNRNSLSASIGWRSGKKITILPKALIPLCYIDLLEQQGILAITKPQDSTTERIPA